MGTKNPGELAQTNEVTEISMTDLASLVWEIQAEHVRFYRFGLMEEPGMVKMPLDLEIASQLLLVLHQDHRGKNSFSQQCSSTESIRLYVLM